LCHILWSKYVAFGYKIIWILLTFQVPNISQEKSKTKFLTQAWDDIFRCILNTQSAYFLSRKIEFLGWLLFCICTYRLTQEWCAIVLRVMIPTDGQLIAMYLNFNSLFILSYKNLFFGIIVIKFISHQTHAKYISPKVGIQRWNTQN